ncbi:RNA-directed DNA polymerase-like protein [Plakobranchus ocellatus]|uniref:RNA-directed DNA polymerase-like protein n=1 Tax=Plakobranchus ocellatus TaxID=259542 RepID=A0AAV4BXK6_9GAST|nr:RNA-directed DNA polymerase-like protein [Plakobranchus ocellatus]
MNEVVEQEYEGYETDKKNEVSGLVLYKASPQKGNFRLSGPPSGQGSVADSNPRQKRPCRSQGGLTSHCATDALNRADCPPTALPSFRPPCTWRFFSTISIAAMLWAVAVSEEEFAEVSHGTKGKTCMACKKPNHFAKVCRSKPKAANVRQVEENESSDEDVFSIKSHKKVSTAIIQLDDHPVSCIVDTGASVNILTKETFTKLKKKPVLRPSSTAIFGYSSDQRLTVLGCFTTTVKHRQKNTTSKFFVVDGNSGSSNLLSGDTSEKLRLIKYLNQVNIPTDLYSGFGKIKDLKIKLHIDDQVPPKAQDHRRIPYHTRKDVEREIKRLEEADIIESVEGPTPWVSPIVIVP